MFQVFKNYFSQCSYFGLPPAPVKGAPGQLAAFLCLFPLFCGLYSRRYLFRAKDPLDPLIVGGDLPQGLVLHLCLLQAFGQVGKGLTDSKKPLPMLPSVRAFSLKRLGG